jgi:uncharacterized cupredoxin-like copper-binding protein
MRLAYPAAAVAILVAGSTIGGPGAAQHSHGNHAHGPQVTFSAGEPGNPKQRSRDVEITMRESDGKMVFVPNRLEVRRNEQVRFVLKNDGVLDHEFMLATVEENAKHAELMQKHPEMSHDDHNGRRLKANGNGEILWRFTKRGEFEFACLLPGHYPAGMFGKIVVK